MKNFKYVSLFSGIGGFEQALNKLGGECVLASEIDKFANQAYEIIYGEKTVGDITKVNAEDVPDHDLLVGGFPCQAFSVAGKRGGFDDARGTLFFEMARIAAEKMPKVILAENVKGLISHDKGKTLDTIVKTLNECGYRVDFDVLNSKYFGVPQNRERIFIVAVREDLVENEPWLIEGKNVVAKGKHRISEYDDVKTFNFDFPNNDVVTNKLRDILEPIVEERYYLSEEKTAKLVAKLNDDERSNTPKCVHNIYGGFKEAKPRVFDNESPTIRTSSGGGHLPSVLEEVKGLPIREATNKGYAVAREGDAVNFQFPDSKTRRGRVGKQIAQTLEASNINQGVVESFIARNGNVTMESSMEDIKRECEIIQLGHTGTGGQRGRIIGTYGISPCLSATEYKQPTQIADSPMYRIRKLIPLECFRLQGFSDQIHQKLVDAGISDSQRYKMAGNAVTTNVIEAIGKNLLPYI
ncbi:DNA (cytosine-5-)-methyltransferase [Oceanobacillus kimchii]|uniref:Cytosine-specific methyltransferase n=1 Tax=Oceanobacillus kimchii TaxID=746691 RepID=A0ABQ5TKL6_9BACI|nr:DNA (cytosine-5-)-methyltransferase [Oceanobacillus kimchii]GLO66239.1 hypothetical protein MACH08_20230 [Oceanobacillus kimchii]